MQPEWYYTANQQQMGPVSWRELRDLASNGTLKPHDLVWSEGMEEWIKAIDQEGLFPADTVEAVAAIKESFRVEPRRTASSRARVRDADNEEEVEEDDRPARRKSKNRKQQTGMAPGLKIGLIVGGGLLVLTTLSCCVISIVLIAINAANNKDDGARNYTVTNLRPGAFDERRFTFQQGKRVTITVTNNVQFPNTDVDLRVFRGALGADLFALDERIPAQNMHCRVEFVVPVSDIYRIQVVNLGPGNANQCVVNIAER